MSEADPTAAETAPDPGSGPSHDLAAWRDACGALLERWHLTLEDVRTTEVAPPVRERADGLADTHLPDLALLGTLPAVSVALFGGMGDAAREGADKPAVKKRCDFYSSMALDALLTLQAERYAPGATIEVAVGEGSRIKPGETGGNPTLAPGMTFGKADGEVRWRVVLDAVDCTSRTATGKDGGLVEVGLLSGTIRDVPDLYLNVLMVGRTVARAAADAGLRLTCDAEPSTVVELVRRAHELDGPGDVVVWCLDRPRHAGLVEAYREAGARVLEDGELGAITGDGTFAPVYALDGRPIHVVAGLGGAAEGLGAAWVTIAEGGAAGLRFATGGRSWAERHGLSSDEIRDISAAGLDPLRSYQAVELVPDPAEYDGAMVAGAITANPYLLGDHETPMPGVTETDDGATADAVVTGADGRRVHVHLRFGWTEDRAAAERAFRPLFDTLMAMDDLEELRRAVHSLDSPERLEILRRELRALYYDAMEIESTDGGRDVIVLHRHRILERALRADPEDREAAETSVHRQIDLIGRIASDLDPAWLEFRE